MKNKVVIITGASSGIGKATAFQFAKMGAKVVIAARSVDKLDMIAKEIEAIGAKVLPVKCDVSNENDCKQLISQSIKRFKQIDVLINNAGISMRALFEETDLNVIKNVMNINFWGCVYCTKYALPYLLQSKGSIAGISSIAGYVGLPARTGYSASKFAMHGFLEALRIENLENDLHVLIASPGFTSSNIRNMALVGDGTSQGKSPRTEDKMMSAEEVAFYIYRSIKLRKQRMVLTTEGKMAVFLSKWAPQFLQRMVFSKMKKEDNSPLK